VRRDLDSSLNFDEVRRPLHDNVVSNVEVPQRRKLGQFVWKLVNEVVGHVETGQTAQLVDVFGQLLQLVAGQVELREMIEQNPVVRKLFELIEGDVQHLTTGSQIARMCTLAVMNTGSEIRCFGEITIKTKN